MIKVYHAKRLEKAEVLEQDTYKGYEYTIITLGTHPCSYITIPKGHRFYEKHYDEIPLRCHGGLTYSEHRFLGDDHKDKWIVGWDYAHLGDWMPYDSFGGHKWSFDELQSEVFEAIDELVRDDSL